MALTGHVGQASWPVRFLLIALSGIALAQIGINGTFWGSPIDYYGAHPVLEGDTNYCVQTAPTYASGASAGTFTLNRGDGNGAVTMTGKVLCTLNDGGSPVATGNIWVYNLNLDMTSAANTTLTALNQMTGFGINSGAIDAPAGWAGQCTAGHANSCNWKSGKPIAVNGWVVLPVFRQDVAAYYNGSDSTFIASPDGGAHWCNPYTFYGHAGSPGCDSSNWNSAGDAPDAPGTAKYIDAAHSVIMWKDSPPFDGSTNRMGRVAFFEYCQDNSCTGMPHNADNYLYAFGQTGRWTRVILARVPKDIVKIMDPAQWTYYNHPNYQPSDVGNGTEWTGNLAAAVDLFSGTATSQSPRFSLYLGYTEQMGEFQSPIYLCANGGCAYVSAATNFFTSGGPNPGTQIFVLGFPAPWGPFTRRSEQTNNLGPFWNFMRFTAWTPDSNPYHSRVVSAWNGYAHKGTGTVYFQTFDLQAAAPAKGTQLVGHTPLRFSMGVSPNALIRDGLQRYFDFYDHQGYDTMPTLYSLDLVHDPPSAQMIGCYTDSGVACGIANPGKALSWDASGVAMGNGYSARLELRDLNMAAGTGGNFYSPLSDATFSGNGGDSSFSVSLVAKTTDNTLTQGMFNAGPSTQQVYVQVGGGGSLSLVWQIAPVVFIQTSTAAGVIANNTWYNVVATYAAGGQLNPGNCAARVKLYVNGALVPSTYGSYPPSTTGTPNIGSGSIYGAYTPAGAGYSLQGTLAGLGWYNRALSPTEISHNYTVLKAALQRRGIALQ